MENDLLAEDVEQVFIKDESVDQRLLDFTKKVTDRANVNFAALTFPVETIDPLACLNCGWNNRNFQYYWENPSENFAIAARGELVSMSASGSTRFADINNQRQAVIDQTVTFAAAPHAYSGLMFLGGFSFFDEIGNSHWNSFEAASLTVPKWLVFKDDKYCFITIFLNIQPHQNPGQLYERILHKLRDAEERLNQARKNPILQKNNSNPQKKLLSQPEGPQYQNWIFSVEKAKKQIRQKTFDKIVLARQLSVSHNRHPADMLHSLREKYPKCSCFLVHPPEGNSFLGATPERLASFQHHLLLTEALAGSIERGNTTSEDTALENNLSISTKNRDEHGFVVHDIKQRLQPLTDGINYSKRPQIKKLVNVQHLYTPIRAKIKPDTDMIFVLEQLHPTPAVGGYPWEKAAPHIQKSEQFERGWYAGPVGWCNASGSGEFAVAIRSGLLGPDRAHFFAGCGIVADSDPQAEWEETNLKLKPMLSAL